MVKHRRPVNLNLLTIRQPVTAVLSILHRITGMVLFLSLPLILWALGLTLSGPEGFDAVADYLDLAVIKTLVLAIWAAAAFHLSAGIRHIIMDFGWGETLKSARASAYGVLVLTAALVVSGGVWLW